MRDCDAVFKLTPNMTDPRLVGFGIGRGARSVLGLKTALDDLSVINGMSLSWRTRPLAKHWKPMPVTGAVHPFNDYPCLELTDPVFSRRAVDALGDMLTANGDLLPLKTDLGEYFLYVVQTKLDVLNVERSRLSRDHDREVAARITYFDFREPALAHASIFRIPEQPNYTLVTDRFKKRVDQAGLNGFEFWKVWPLTENSDWFVEHRTARKKSPTAKLTGEALGVRFTLGGEDPTVAEKKLAAAIEASLATALKVDSLDAPYQGSIELSEFADGEFRVFCTCPNAEQLVEFLKPWLDQVAWDGDVAITKRFGNFYDTKAKEKRVQIRGDSPPSRHRK